MQVVLNAFFIQRKTRYFIAFQNYFPIEHGVSFAGDEMFQNSRLRFIFDHSFQLTNVCMTYLLYLITKQNYFSEAHKPIAIKRTFYWSTYMCSKRIIKLSFHRLVLCDWICAAWWMISTYLKIVNEMNETTTLPLWCS